MGFLSKRKKDQTEPRQLVIITGCAGSGKTTVGKELARQLGYAYIDKDTVTRDFTDFILTKLGSFDGDRESELYRTEVLPIEYRISFKLCREIIDTGCSAILTIPFISQIKDYTRWQSILREAKFKSDVQIKFIWIEHNIDTEKANIRKRAAARDQYKMAHWEEYAASVNGIAPAPEYDAFCYVNDCDINQEDALKEVIRWLKK